MFSTDRAIQQAIEVREWHPGVVALWENMEKLGVKTRPLFLTPSEMAILKGDPDGTKHSEAEAESADSASVEDTGEFGSGITGGGSLTGGGEDEPGGGLCGDNQGPA